uniref:hypothetical protein n=1 Tax=Ameyamaea chiangmaiensis TaxID=442969 RepID=UPI002230269F|nr:hypothetical protein [Ameyamaea chiangmaiensis]
MIVRVEARKFGAFANGNGVGDVLSGDIRAGKEIILPAGCRTAARRVWKRYSLGWGTALEKDLALSVTITTIYFLQIFSLIRSNFLDAGDFDSRTGCLIEI